MVGSRREVAGCARGRVNCGVNASEDAGQSSASRRRPRAGGGRREGVVARVERVAALGEPRSGGVFKRSKTPGRPKARRIRASETRGFRRVEGKVVASSSVPPIPSPSHQQCSKCKVVDAHFLYLLGQGGLGLLQLSYTLVFESS